MTRRAWVKGHDFRTLALAATEQLGSTPDECQYSLISPDTRYGSRSALLEVVPANGDDDADALLGPMASPLPDEFLIDRRFSLNALIENLGVEQPSREIPAGRPDEVGDETPRGRAAQRGWGRYQVIVTYTPICNWEPGRRRQPRDADLRYKQEIDSAERLLVERSRHQGIYLVEYDVPPDEWSGENLEILLELAYRLLPATEPRWRETGSIVPATFVSPADLRDGQKHPQRPPIAIAPCLRVGRGDYVAHFRLPFFPARAIAEWIASRHYEINLRHPMFEEKPVRAAAAYGTPAVNKDSPSRKPADSLPGIEPSGISMCDLTPRPPPRRIFDGADHRSLFVRRYDQLLSRARMLPGSRVELAYDLVHEAFVRFVTQEPTLDDIHDLDAYLYGMLRYLNISTLRRSGRFPMLPIADFDSVLVSQHGNDGTASIHALDELAHLCRYASLRKQTSSAASVLVLRFFWGFSPSAVALLCHVSPTVVAYRLRQARVELGCISPRLSASRLCGIGTCRRSSRSTRGRQSPTSAHRRSQ